MCQFVIHSRYSRSMSVKKDNIRMLAAHELNCVLLVYVRRCEFCVRERLASRKGGEAPLSRVANISSIANIASI